MATSLSKKPRMSPPPADLLALPAIFINSIFAFAVSQEVLSPNLWKPPTRAPSKLLAVATVSKDWFTCVDRIVSARALDTFLLDSALGNGRKALLAVRNELIMRRPHLRQLYVVTSFPHHVFSSLFSHAPHLTFVDLKCISRFNEVTLAGIVEATARQCPRMKSIRFPGVWTGRGTDNSSGAMLPAMTRALKSWHESNGGLRRLWLPNQIFHSGPRWSCWAQEYLAAVALYCPAIEVLEGFNKDHDRNAHVLSERWFSDLTTWQRFCQSCPRLKSIHWGCLPFATAYFQAFGQTTKLNLKSILLFAHPYGDWQRLLASVGEEDAQTITSTGYGRTATDVGAVLLGCPNLQELQIRWREPQAANATTPQEMACDLRVYDDDFFETLATACLRLDTLRFEDDHSHIQQSQLVHVSISDESLTHLAQLKHLGVVRISGASVGGRGLAELVLAPTPYAKSPRFFKIAIGRPTAAGDRGFYDTLYGLLERLAAREPGASGCCLPLWLRLTNEALDEVDHQWSASYWAAIKQFADTVRARHPRLVVRVLMNGYDGTGFKRIRQLQVHTVGMAAQDLEWGHTEHYGDAFEDTAVDPVFMNRTFLRYFPDEEYETGESRFAALALLRDPRVLRRI